MTEKTPGQRPVTHELLASSQKVLPLLHGKVNIDTVGAITGAINTADTHLTSSEKRRIKRRRKKKLSSKDIANFHEAIDIFVAGGELPKNFNNVELNTILKDKKDKLFAEEKRRETRRTIGIISVATAGILVLSGITGKIVYDYMQENNRAYEQSILLTDRPSAPSYSGWRIEVPDPDVVYIPTKNFTTVDEGESIALQIGNEKVDTGFEPEIYEKTDGSKTIRILNPLDDPFLVRVLDKETVRKDSNYYRSEEWLLPNNSRLLNLTNNKGTRITVQITDSTPDAASGDHRFTITPMEEQKE